MAYYIHWFDGEGKVPRETIKEVEDHLGIRFPEAYVQIVMEHNEAAPLPYKYYFEGPDGKERSSEITGLYPFYPEKSMDQQGIVHIYNRCLEEKRIPEGVYPFATGSYIDLTCFDYRNTVNGEPGILWWCDYDEPNHKGLEWGAIYPVCDSFSEFLERLNFSFKWIEVGRQINREEINKVEQAWGVTFPEDYVQCVMQYNGGRPSPNDQFWYGSVVGKKKIHVFKQLLSFDGDEAKTNILSVYDSVRDQIEADVYPIIACKPDDYVCLDYRNSRSEEPKIILWKQDENVYYPVDDIFTLFLAGLFED